MRGFFARALRGAGKRVIAETEAVVEPRPEPAAPGLRPMPQAGSAGALHAEELASTFALPPGALDLLPARLSAYLMVEPFLHGCSVLDVGGGGAASLGLLRRSGATVTVAEVAALEPGGAPLDDSGFDVVLCLADLTAAWEPARPRRLIQRLAPLVRPGGMLVVRTESHDGPLRPSGRVGLSRSSLQVLLAPLFRFVDIVDQVPLLGFSFAGATTPRLAVSEALMPRSAPPSHHLAFATSADPRPYDLGEQLLVPCARPEAAVPMRSTADLSYAGQGEGAAAPGPQGERSGGGASLDEHHREIERLRERLMETEDERDRLRATAATLRREADRRLRQLSEQAAALEVLSLQAESGRSHSV